MAIPGQSAKLNVHQSVPVAKLPNLMPAECTTLIVFMRHHQLGTYSQLGFT